VKRYLPPNLITRLENIIATPRKVKIGAGKSKRWKVVSGVPPWNGAGDKSPKIPRKIPGKPMRRNLMPFLNTDAMPKTPPMQEINDQGVAT
jgi:hypothetical protein